MASKLVECLNCGATRRVAAIASRPGQSGRMPPLRLRRLGRHGDADRNAPPRSSRAHGRAAPPLRRRLVTLPREVLRTSRGDRPQARLRRACLGCDWTACCFVHGSCAVRPSRTAGELSSPRARPTRLEAWRRRRRATSSGVRNDKGGCEFSGLRRADSGARRSLARPHQGRGGARERRARAPRRGQGAAHRRRGDADRQRRARRPVSDRRLPDGLGHVVEHERERGDRLARGRRRPRERRRQHGPVVQRRLPVRRPPCRARRDRERAASGARDARDVARGEGARVRRRRQVGPHPLDGRGARDARPGVRRLRGAGASGHRARARHAAEARPDSARRNGRRHRPEHASRVRRASSCAAVRRDGPRDRRAGRPVRGAGRARRPRRDVGRAEDRRRVADQDRERSPLHGLGPARRAGRDLPARAPEGQLDHAGEGQSRSSPRS